MKKEIRNSKEEIRKSIWDGMLEKGIAKHPLPPHNRIPNFHGAEKAAELLTKLEEWKNSEVLKINPDSPQMEVRYRALSEGKTVLMPTPRIKQGFLLIDPKKIPRSLYRKASTIKGAFELGKKVEIYEIPEVDFIVEGSVAVNEFGERIGKGEGYGELEFAILLEIGKIEKDVPIATTVHEFQVLNIKFPQDPYDVQIDYIVTPKRIIKVEKSKYRPNGIIWELLSEKKIKEIPLLNKLIKN
ncbi:MAG: 5-formyltetrahydrofolate cyclo-ligase [Archaeoglobaceae archaeon]|nr:5-formyltetrahydrofolate cyclo-ligase [Archaeoglobaceae archaeon]MCX8151725.1 5-formyltetrahydrofolate cyclo-ligase [Archaeoglobaceae archaeon]MDW8013854.1 5-formyltetrahydrofolate cyclo-ligase [Archaeoglobaceae archaeon]